MSLLTKCLAVTAVTASLFSVSAQAGLFDSVETKVAKDAESQYNIAKKGTDKVQICVSASFVVAAWLQAKNDKKFQEWQKVEKADCAAAGIAK